MSYPTWAARYSNEAFDRTQNLAAQLTEQDRQNAVPGTPAHGYSRARFDEARQIVEAAHTFGSEPA